MAEVQWGRGEVAAPVAAALSSAEAGPVAKVRAEVFANIAALSVRPGTRLCTRDHGDGVNTRAIGSAATAGAYLGPIIKRSRCSVEPFCRITE